MKTLEENKPKGEIIERTCVECVHYTTCFLRIRNMQYAMCSLAELTHFCKHYNTEESIGRGYMIMNKKKELEEESK